MYDSIYWTPFEEKVDKDGHTYYEINIHTNLFNYTEEDTMDNFETAKKAAYDIFDTLYDEEKIDQETRRSLITNTALVIDSILADSDKDLIHKLVFGYEDEHELKIHWFKTKIDAERVLNYLKTTAKNFNVAKVSDYYDSVTPKIELHVTDYNYGWTFEDLKEAYILKIGEHAYYIHFPQPRDVSDLWHVNFESDCTDDFKIETPYDWNWCYFDSHDDALECLQKCMHIAETNKSGYCEVASYYDKAGEYGEIKYPDWAHGWTLDDLQKAEIFECPKRRNKKWTIRFPEARRIKNGDDEVKEDSSFPFKYWDHFRIITENAIDADLAVMNLDMIIDYKGYCTIKDLYDVSYRFQDPGTTPKTEDTDENNNFGWTERGFAEIDPETDYVRLTKAPKLLTWQDKNKKED